MQNKKKSATAYYLSTPTSPLRPCHVSLSQLNEKQQGQRLHSFFFLVCYTFLACNLGSTRGGMWKIELRAQAAKEEKK